MPFLIVHKQKQTDAIIRLQSAGEIPAGTIVMERSPEHSDVFLITAAVSPFDSCSFRESEKQLKSLVLRSLQKAEEAHCESITLLPVMMESQDIPRTSFPKQQNLRSVSFWKIMT